MQGLGLLVLRLVLGLTFVAHGLPKLVPVWGMSPRAISALLGTAGVIPAYPITVGLGLVELLAGVLLLVGAYTFWTSVMLAATTSVVAWKVHLPHGFFLNWTMSPGQGHGLEYAFVVVGALGCLMCAGPGLFAVDRRRAQAAEARKLSRAVLRAGKTKK